jgi:hypothetical protein
MKELAKRREEQSARGKGKSKNMPIKATSGLSAGIKTKNKHLAEFQNMKDGFRKRKEDLNRKAPVRRPPLAPIASKRGAIGAKQQSQVYGRIGSQSAPPRDSVGQSAAAGGGINAVLSIARRGAPTTHKAGTSTRRIQSGNPIRRVGGAEVPLPTNAISVSGIGGVRNIRASARSNNLSSSEGGVIGIAGRRK